MKPPLGVAFFLEN